MLELINVVKSYNIDKNRVDAVNDISFSLEEGTFLSVVGKSGSGKSTLLHLIGGLDDVTSGQIFLDGAEISDMREKELVKYRRKNIGFVFQFFNLIPELTARDNIILAQQLSGTKYDAAYYEKITGILEIENRLTHLPGQLSGGEQQRVAIARALITKPKLLLLDEPTGNLDNDSSVIVTDMIRKIKDEIGQTVIMVTHDTESANQADRMITLRNGTVEKDILL